MTTTTRDYSRPNRKRDCTYFRQSVREKALAARCKDLEADRDTALGLMHEKDDVIVRNHLHVIALTTQNAQLTQLAERRRLDLVAMTFEVDEWKDLAEQQRLSLVATRKWLPESCR